MPMIQFQGNSYSLNEGENLLDGLLRHNAKIPHSCRGGVCHSCLLRVTAPADAQPTATTNHILACQTMVSAALNLTLPCRDEIPGIITALTPCTATEVAIRIATRLPLSITVGDKVTLVSADSLEANFTVTACDEHNQTLECTVTRIAGGNAFSAWVHAQAVVGDRLMVIKVAEPTSG